MPITFTTDPERRRNLATATGPVTYSEITAHLDELKAAGVLSWSELVDGTGATAAVTPAEVRRVVEFLRDLAEEYPLGATALVVGDDATFGMARMLGTLAEELCDVRPFRRREDAEAWLDSVANRSSE